MPNNAHMQRAMLDTLGEEACLTVNDLVACTELSRKQVSRAAAGLVRRGYIERLERGCFRLTVDGREAKQQGLPLNSGPHRGPTRPRRNTFRGKLWRAMRLKEKFTIGDVVALSVSGIEKNPENNAHAYVRNLCRSGYVRELPRRSAGTALTSNGFKRYALIRNTGEYAPVIRKNGKVVFDPNTGEEVPCQR